MKYRVGILGATGAVGQKFVELLDGHPWFEVTAIVASERSAGKTYRHAANWIGQAPLPDAVGDLVVHGAKDAIECDFVFSGLDASVAEEIESDFASRGFPVISNARNFRMRADIPLLIPEVNPDHIRLIDSQKWPDGGFIATNPNCSTVGLVSAVKPLHDAFGIKALHVTTMQALSGAGYPGVPSLDILGNVVPYIDGEEEKIALEPRKLLGTMTETGVDWLNIPISAQCNRVPVVDGHLLSVSLTLEGSPSLDAVKSALKGYETPISGKSLPSAPEKFIEFFDDPRYPQPLRQGMLGRGMTVSVGRLAECPVLGHRLVALSHNTIRGAAGGAILNAELLISEGYITH